MPPSLLRLVLAFFAAPCASGRGEPRVIGYLPTWGDFPASIHRVQLSRLTHLMIAFCNPKLGNPDEMEVPDGLAAVVAEANRQGVQVLLSLGGANVDVPTYELLLAPEKVDAFVATLAGLTDTYRLAGIDVDLEHAILQANAAAPARYEAFVGKLRSALHARAKTISAALTTSLGDKVTTRAAQQFDFICLMSYDATGPWDPAHPGPHAPYAMAADDLTFWSAVKGIDRSRLVVGLPFYGYAWGSYATPPQKVTSLPYSRILSRDPDAAHADQIGDGANALYYNGVETIRAKARLAGTEAGGVMIWELLGDAPGEESLLRAIDLELHPLGNAQLTTSPATPGQLRFHRAPEAACRIETSPRLTGEWSTVASYDPAARAWVRSPSASTATITETPQPDGFLQIDIQLPAGSAAGRVFYRVSSP